MMRLSIALLGLGSTTACIGGTNPLEGVWVFFVDADYDTTSDSDCSENYNDADCPASISDEDSPWTFESTEEQDTDTFVAQIVGIGGGQAIMFVNDLILTGEKNDSGNWLFIYEDFQNVDNNSSHEAGYSFKQSEESSDVLSFSLEQKRGSFTGSMELTSQATMSWSESDVWNSAEVGMSSSQIPANSYLSSEGMFGNNPVAADCSEGLCGLSISGSSQMVIGVTAERTDVKNEGDLDALEDDGDFGWNLGSGD